MQIEILLRTSVIKAIETLYQSTVSNEQIQIQVTRKEFEGDFTLVVFPFLKISKKNPEVTAQEIGEELKKSVELVVNYNVIKGFLNISLSTEFWLDELKTISLDKQFGLTPATETSPLYMIEYSSPNTNKPLHLGHIRNNLLGYSVSKIAAANGNRVVKTNIVNDRGVHICKSMLAWKKWGEGETPETSGLKGDHLVGKYYVKFDQEYKKELSALMANGLTDKEAEAQSTLMAEVRDMLLSWEADDKATVDLWKMMNSWVYAGFDVTYKALGVDFDKIYYESDTYTVGRDMVLEGYEKGILNKRADGTICADLTGDGLDEKVLLRSDGTSVYMTQDIGTAKLRFDDYKIDRMVYVVGNEQNYHFQVLSLVLDKLGFSWGKSLYHFAYGMVELPEGKMKSREGTVVDADDLIKEMIDTAREMSQELGKLEGYSNEEAEEVYRTIALGALKYYILKVDPRKTMTFNPKESIDFNGNTGPFIQYTYARIQSIMRKGAERGINITPEKVVNSNINAEELQLIKLLAQFPAVVKAAGDEFSPALIANFVYDLAKAFNHFYHEFAILQEENEDTRQFRLILSQSVADAIKNAMSLLGVNVPERM